MTKNQWIKHIEESGGVIAPSRGGNRDKWTNAVQQHSKDRPFCLECKARRLTMTHNESAKTLNKVYGDLGMKKVKGGLGGTYYESRQPLKETGEMSKWDIQKGGEDYEWAEFIAHECKLIQRRTKGKFQFIRMNPFDKYLGPYALCVINGKMARVWSDAEGLGSETLLFVADPFDWTGTPDEITAGVRGNEEMIKLLKIHTKGMRESVSKEDVSKEDIYKEDIYKYGTKEEVLFLLEVLSVSGEFIRIYGQFREKMIKNPELKTKYANELAIINNEIDNKTFNTWMTKSPEATRILDLFRKEIVGKIYKGAFSTTK